MADIVQLDVLTDFDSEQSKETLDQTTALITGWGSPVLDAGALDAAPALQLIAHAAGTVKAHVSPECWARGLTVTTAGRWASSGPPALDGW